MTETDRDNTGTPADLDGEVAEGEIVTAEEASPEPAMPTPEEQAETIDRVVASLPGVAARDEFLSLAMQARTLSLSGAAPQGVRDHPYIALHVAMIGRDLGISPSAAVELIDVLYDEDHPERTRISMSPQLLLGQVRRLGLGRIDRVVSDNTRCVARAVNAKGEVLGETEFTWQDAQIAGLVDPRCTGPTEHFSNPQASNWKDRKCKCRQGWRTYPKRMLWWRAGGYAVDDFFPEAGLGLYSAEELGATVDDQGRPIDAATVELPPGFPEQETAAGTPAAAAAPSTPAAKPVDLEALNGMADTVNALPETQRKALAESWRANGFPSLARMTSMLRDGEVVDTRMFAFLRDLVAHQVEEAEKGGWDRTAAEAAETARREKAQRDNADAPRETAQSQEAPSEPSEPAPAPNPPAEPSEGESGPPEPAPEPSAPETVPESASEPSSTLLDAFPGATEEPAEPERPARYTGPLDPDPLKAAVQLTGDLDDDTVKAATEAVKNLTPRVLAQRYKDLGLEMPKVVPQAKLLLSAHYARALADTGELPF